MAHNKRRTTTRPPPSTTHDTGLVPLSCPDCFGVLHFEREGHHDHLLYRCQVGHRYSVGSLIQAKEAQLERTLWSASLLLKQMAFAYEDLSSEMKHANRTDRSRVRQRMNEVRKHSLAIQAMIEAAYAVE
jgi:hypothetical protein